MKPYCAPVTVDVLPRNTQTYWELHGPEDVDRDTANTSNISKTYHEYPPLPVHKETLYIFALKNDIPLPYNQ